MREFQLVYPIRFQHNVWCSAVNPIRFQYYVWFRCLSNQISALCLVPLSIQSDFSIMSGSVVYPIRLQHLVWFRCLSNQISALCLVSLSIQSDFSIMYGLYCTVLLEHPAYNVRIIWCNDFGFGWNNWWWYVNLNPFLPPPSFIPSCLFAFSKGLSTECSEFRSFSCLSLHRAIFLN